MYFYGRALSKKFQRSHFLLQKGKMTGNNNFIMIPKFDGSNYEYWSIRMRTILKGKGFWKIMEDGYNDPKYWNALSVNQKKDMEDNDMKNKLALALIQSTLFEILFS